MPYEHFKAPKVFFVGATNIHPLALQEYFDHIGCPEFLEEISHSELNEGAKPGEILCSIYAKLCYASFSTEKNKNLTKTRSIAENILGTLGSGHGSVFEHVYLNFIVSDCSRIFTHEMVRHRAGTSFSQESGRYVRKEHLDLVVDPILSDVYEEIEEIRQYLEEKYHTLTAKYALDDEAAFDRKKKITSALRRILPEGRVNEFGFGVNLRSLRHIIELRTNRHAEWEIRNIFAQVYRIVKNDYPLIFADSQEEMIDNEIEVKFKNKKI